MLVLVLTKQTTIAAEEPRMGSGNKSYTYKMRSDWQNYGEKMELS
jgi:hypothetical protein